MGYLRGVWHGLLIGGAVALMYAPKPGRELRQDLADRFETVKGQVQPVINQAQDVVESARPQVERGISKAQQRIRKGGGSSQGTAYAGPASVGSGGSPSPGV